ncbi:MAG: glycine cleavage system protein GcvH [Candidatus Omnitrophica bacterium]|nr:glycine cleavage system protein GcvH [Candidatus Omnitrophota bacterium]MDD5691151.1 glycine cleavage system protein GcvH [Candidatus Omnitrophota bacterium]
MTIPENLLYTKDHEWARLDGDKATMGITDFAQGSLGDITFIDLPKPGAKVEQSKWCATVESVKAASDVYAPFSGEVLKVNTQLTGHPELVNKSAYDAGWFAVVKISDLEEKNKLMNSTQYKEYIQGLSK